MRFLSAFALLAFLASVVVSMPSSYRRTADYTDHKLFRCTFPNRPDSDALYDLVHAFGLDVWTHRPNGEIDLRLTPEQLSITFLSSYFTTRCQLVSDNVEKLIVDAEMEWAAVPKNAEWFEEYHTYDEIYAWYKNLAAAYPTLATFVPSIGRSSEGRDQPAFHLTSTRGSNKPKIYFQCQIHAREWISGAVCSYIVNHFVTNYGKHDNVTALLDSLEFVVVPFVNPDGYAYTWSNDRLWRKNREKNSGSTCIGVDLNRNYNSHWGQGGSSTSPCSDTYMGPSAGSSIETKNTVAYFKKNAPIYGAIDWHSYSQLILRPWGYTRTNSPDETFLKSVGDGIRAEVLASGGVAYTSQKSIDLYVTTGTASDWFYDTEATSTNGGYRAAGFTIELRDTGRYGFQLPPDQIIPNGKEMVAAAIYFAERVLASPIRA